MATTNSQSLVPTCTFSIIPCKKCQFVVVWLHKTQNTVTTSWCPQKIPKLPLKIAQFCEFLSEETLINFVKHYLWRILNCLGFFFNSANVIKFFPPLWAEYRANSSQWCTSLSAHRGQWKRIFCQVWTDTVHLWSDHSGRTLIPGVKRCVSSQLRRMNAV